MTSASYLRRQQKLAPYLFVAPFLLLFCIFGIYPIVKSITLSFYASAGPQDVRPVGFKNYQFLFDEFARGGDFYKAVRNTVVYALSSVFVQLPLALGLALLLSRKDLKARSFWRLAFFSPNLMGQVFVGVLFAVLFQPKFGLINRVYAFLTHNPVNAETKWLSDPAMVMPALVLTSLWMYVGYNMIYFLAALQAVDKDLYEAAVVDGANPAQQFWNVTLPQIRPVAVFVLVTATIGSLQLFELPYILLNNTPGPDGAGLTVVMYLYQNGFAIGDLGYASAVGWVLALGMFVISMIQVKLTKVNEKN